MKCAGGRRGQIVGLKIVALLWALAIAHHALAFSGFSSNFVQAELNYPPPPNLQGPRGVSSFAQHSSNFWAFDRASNSWKLTDLSCLFSNGSWWHSCSGRRNAIPPGRGGEQAQLESTSGKSNTDPTQFDNGGSAENSQSEFPKGTESVQPRDAPRNLKSGSINPPRSHDPIPDTTSFESAGFGRVSMVRFSDVSIWITGQSGAIYERFWNGVQWVVIPHDLPAFSGRASAVLSVNRTMVAMSESGILHQVCCATL